MLLTTSDYINIAGIIINAVLAAWIIIKLQNKINNKRVLKDHLMSEMKSIRDEYLFFFNKLIQGEIEAKTVIPWFKLMSLKINSHLPILNKKYNIQTDCFIPFQLTLLDMVTNNRDFMIQFEKTEPVTFSAESKVIFMKFMQSNNHLFNDIIIKINDAK